MAIRVFDGTDCLFDESSNSLPVPQSRPSLRAHWRAGTDGRPTLAEAIVNGAVAPLPDLTLAN